MGFVDKSVTRTSPQYEPARRERRRNKRIRFMAYVDASEAAAIITDDTCPAPGPGRAVTPGNRDRDRAS